ncbi:MAG: hypothetical protein R3D02_03535 [Hyphomicrobiales bacterium]
MSQSARVLVIDEGITAERSRIWSDLDQFGFETTSCAPADVPLIGAAERPDVIVVDGRSGASVREFTSLSRIGSDNAPPPAILFLAADGDEASSRAIGAGRVLYPPVEPGRLALSLSTLLRQNALEQEIGRRIAAAERIGLATRLTPPASDAATGASVLVVGVGRTFLKIESSLSCFAEVFGALSIDQAESYLNAATFDAVVIEPSIDFDDAIAFVADIRRNPRVATLPVVMLLDPNFMMGLREAYAAGATDVMPTSFKADDFAVRMAVHAGEVHAQRDLYATVRALGADRAAGQDDGRYLEAYLEIATEQSRVSGAPVHVATVTVSGLPAIGLVHGEAVANAACDQVATILERLARAENLIARLDRSHFALTFVGAPVEAVETAVTRMAAVIRLTPLGFGEDESLMIDVDAAIATLRPGEPGLAAVERALAITQG